MAEKVNIPVDTELTASDGNAYRWLGAQWVKVTASGKTSQVARRAIGAELTKKALTAKKGPISTRGKQQASAKWFAAKVGESAKGFKAKSKPPALGKMYTFGYDAKHKATLPYWDKFPLIILLDVHKDGFLGLNFHYLAPIQREKFLRAILKFSTQKGDPETFTNKAYFKMSWQAVKGIPGAEKMIHKYLYNHVATSLLEAPANEWENVIYLPYQKFVGASAKSVWGK